MISIVLPRRGKNAQARRGFLTLHHIVCSFTPKKQKNFRQKNGAKHMDCFMSPALRKISKKHLTKGGNFATIKSTLTRRYSSMVELRLFKQKIYLRKNPLFLVASRILKIEFFKITPFNNRSMNFICGCRLMVGPQLPKLATRVRFPSSAPIN